jgi:Flp pilus assembly protein TadD
MANLTQPEEFQRALNEGAWLLRQNRPDEALERLLPLYELAPTNPDVAINLGGAYILLSKWNKAERVLSRAAELHADNTMIWMNLAAAHLGRLELAGPKQQERAIRAYERVVALDPRTPNAYYNLGLIYKDRGEHDRATVSFERALEVNPADADARYWIDWLSRQAAPAAADGASGAPVRPSNASMHAGGDA